MVGRSGSRRRGALLVRDPKMLDLAAVERAAGARGWSVVIERLGGGDAGWFPEMLRLRVVGDDVDAAVLLTASPGLELDGERRPDDRR